MSAALTVTMALAAMMLFAVSVADSVWVPAVLNVAQAPRRLRDNQQVRLDGEKGYVDIL